MPLRELIEAARASGNWNAVADWCETFDWLSTTDLPAHEFYLDLAVRAEVAIPAPTDVSRQQIAEAVCSARDEGTPWKRIGELLGISSDTAQERYGETSDAIRA